MFRHALPVAVFVSLCALTAQPGSAQTPSATHAAPKSTPVGMVNLNTATVADLEGLPGIGAKTAARIIEYRQKNGPFKKVEELMNVRGVGEKNFLKLKPQITVAAPRAEGNASK
jgi:competence protein ComEA